MMLGRILRTIKELFACDGEDRSDMPMIVQSSENRSNIQEEFEMLTIADFIPYARRTKIVKTLVGSSTAYYCDGTLYLSPAMARLMSDTRGKEYEKLIGQIPAETIESEKFLPVTA